MVGKTPLMLIIIIFFLCLIFTKNFAILVNTSQYWKNMRHSANMHVFYNILRENGFDDCDMVIYTADDFSFDERTYFYGDYQGQSKYPTLTRFPTGPFTPEMIYETIIGNHEKLIDMDENSNLFIYFTGHGNEYFLKLHNKHFITTPCLEKSLLKLSKNINKAFVIFDTCRAESLLVKKTLPDNLLVLTTSDFHEDAMSNIWSDADRVCCMDDFAEYVQAHLVKGLHKTCQQFFDEIQTEFTFESTLRLFPKQEWKMSEFLIQGTTEKEIKKFVL